MPKSAARSLQVEPEPAWRARPYPVVNIIADQPVEAASASAPSALASDHKSAYAVETKADKVSSEKELSLIHI